MILGKPKFNIYENAILRTLFYSRREMTAGEIATSTGISWQTADKHLKKLMKKGIVSKRSVGNRTYWKLK